MLPAHLHACRRRIQDMTDMRRGQKLDDGGSRLMSPFERSDGHRWNFRRPDVGASMHFGGNRTPVGLQAEVLSCWHVLAEC